VPEVAWSGRTVKTTPRTPSCWAVVCPGSDTCTRVPASTRRAPLAAAMVTGTPLARLAAAPCAGTATSAAPAAGQVLRAWEALQRAIFGTFAGLPLTGDTGTGRSFFALTR
jgi:hypothetical protein